MLLEHPEWLSREQPAAPCPAFDPAANKLLSDDGWVKNPDELRTRGKERVEFEYSTTTNVGWRGEDDVILARNLAVIGIKLDIQNSHGIHPLLWRPEIFGRTHHLCNSNRAEGTKQQREAETENGSVRHHQ